eukprot:1147856-Pelagomonas_calceolata.AAC.7
MASTTGAAATVSFLLCEQTCLQAIGTTEDGLLGQFFQMRQTEARARSSDLVKTLKNATTDLGVGHYTTFA